jgi:hypothetical protein
MEIEFGKSAAGLGGVLVGVALKLKEGWRVMLVYGIAGSVSVLVLRGVTEWAALHLKAPPDLVGFFVGALGVAALAKLAEQLQMLELARPVNAFIERWLGAPAPDVAPRPPATGPQGDQP